MLSIAADERAALHFDDVASALDAGLPVEAIGGDAKAGERAVHEALRGRGVKLTPTEDAVLLHAWRAGRVGDALRGRARERQRRADFVRTLWSGLRYPLLIAVLVLMASATTAPIAGTGFLWTVVTIYTTLAIAIFLVLRGLRRSEPWVQRLPGVAGLAADWGELPYLETLAALYGAGVPLKTSHGAAIATVPIADVKSRLRIADGILQQGRPLREALGEAAALHQETRLLLATGEQAGQLESALGRALGRRREVLGRRVEFLGRTAGRVAYTAAVVAVVVIVWRFYSSYYGMLGR